ncbi:MAG: 16S rRNA (guanine(966)-N(2))-methyltransferase RsmD [Candidatus Omnitrophica bacterium]|nr:16S rRNA (guanine(966)-N(2))-methyltransferase RsmD [Candidatus Omnitrophota bacterium]
MVRIAAGTLKGAVIRVPRHLRATGDKVRQALFNILGEQVRGARVLDGFAGSGALGIEALSRGAARVVFLESHPVCVRVLRENLARLPREIGAAAISRGLPVGAVNRQWEVLAGPIGRTARTLARRGETFDLILLDPPYRGEWGRKSLKVVVECAMLSPVGWVCLEHACQSQPPPAVGPLGLVKQHRYGETVLSFYGMAP